VRMQTNWRVGIKSISLRVHAVTDTGIVGGILCGGARQCRHAGLVQTLNVGKNLSKILCPKSHHSAGVAAVIITLAARAKVEVEKALTHACQGDRRLVPRQHWGLTGIGAPFIAVEKEDLVLDDRPTHRAAKSIADQGGASDAGVVVEPVIGSENRIAVGFEGCTVPLVRTRLRDQCDLRTGRPSAARSRVEGSDPELFDGFRVQPEDRSLLGIRYRNVGLRRTNRVTVGFVDVYAIQ